VSIGVYPVTAHNCAEHLCHVRGHVWWPAVKAGDCRRYTLDNGLTLMTREEFDADPRSFVHVLVSPTPSPQEP
jgi:hypothetical protein